MSSQRLFLRGEGFTTLEGRLAQNTTITMLDASNNRLHNLPKEISLLTQMKDLRLSRNVISVLQQDLALCSALESIDISNNNFGSMPLVLGSLPSLQTLNISSNNMTFIGSAVRNMHSLTDLDISMNQLSSLGLEFSNLHSLITLNVGFNNLPAVPREVLSLEQLKSLILSGNCLTSLPESFSTAFPSLELLELDCNDLTALPVDIGRMDKLKKLSFSQNAISSVPESLSELTGLIRLDASHNRLSSLPPTLFAKMSLLKELSLNNNVLEALPGDLTPLRSLTNLYISYNNLTRLPETIPAMEVIKVIHASHNRLEKLPAKLPRTIEDLRIDSNLVSSLNPAAFADCKSLSVLYASCNSISQLPDAPGIFPPSMLALNFAGNRIESLTPALSELPELNSLNLSFNLISEIPTDVFKGSSKLRTLGLAYNKISKIPDELFVTLPNLRQFNASGNLISALPKISPSLTSLYLSNNNINNFDGDWSSYSSLSLLDLSCNGITQIISPAFISALKSIESLSLAGNSLKSFLYPLQHNKCLTDLNLSLNRIDSISQDLMTCTNITRLNLQTNCLSQKSFISSIPVGPAAAAVASGAAAAAAEFCPPSPSSTTAALRPVDVLESVYASSVLESTVVSKNEMFCRKLLSDKVSFAFSQGNDVSGIPAFTLPLDDESFMLYSPSCLPPSLADAGSAKSASGSGDSTDKKSTAANVESEGFESGSSSASKVIRPVFGYSEMCGTRPEMQDASLVVPFFGGHKDSLLMGVFDGHGGILSSNFVAQRLPDVLSSCILFSATVTDALVACFEALDDEICARNFQDGTTALVSLLYQDKLFVASAGDSRAVLCRAGKAYDITQDHSPLSRSEKQRIRGLGGYVSSTGRVNGQVAVARSLGDSLLKPWISSRPDVFNVTIGNDDEFLVLACDGFWEVFSSQQAVDLVRDVPDPRTMATVLRDAAFALDSSDNISVIVLRFAH